MNSGTIDDHGTTSEQARTLLENLCETGFNADVEELAIALGRDADEVGDLLDGTEEIDEDLLMKIRGIAQARNLEIE